MIDKQKVLSSSWWKVIVFVASERFQFEAHDFMVYFPMQLKHGTFFTSVFGSWNKHDKSWVSSSINRKAQSETHVFGDACDVYF